MPISTFMGLETTLRGILAQQAALDTTGHNITNADTVGYSRQTAVLQPTAPMSVVGGLLGTGVEVSGYQRVRDQLLDVQYRAQNMQQGAAQATADGLDQVQAALNEPSDTGLGALIQNYWSAWSDVANTPEDIATRQSLAQSAESLADGFATLSAQLSTITSQTATRVTSVIGQAAVTAEVAQLCAEISQIGSDTEFNGIALLTGGASITFQVGADDGQTITVAATQMFGTGTGVAIDSAIFAFSGTVTLASIDDAIQNVSNSRATFGAVQNRLEHTLNNLSNYEENLTASQSQIRDVDMASEMVNFTKLQILQQAGTSMLAQANQLPQSVLSLLKG